MNHSPPAKVLQISTSDQGGGAERIAWTIFTQFEHRGVDTWLVVGQKNSDHDKVLPIYESPYINYREYGRITARVRRVVACAVEDALGLEKFHNQYSHRLLELTGPNRPDVVICHNLHGGYFDLRTIPRVSAEVPVVMSLADSWMLTGHCAIPGDCSRFQRGCGSCPDLQTPPAVRRDATAWNWRRKRGLYEHSRLYVATPSQWLLGQVKGSILARSIAGAKVIPYGIDLERFAVGSREQARRELGVPPDARILLFVAQDGSRCVRKDYRTVRRAAEICANRDPVLLVVAGEGGADEVSGRLTVRRVGEIRSDSALANWYRAADVLLHASVYESFGLVVAESMACGLPVVATSIGAIPEVMEEGEHGFLVPPHDAHAMAEGALRIMSDGHLSARLSASAAQRARSFDRHAMVDAYLSFCSDAIEEHRRRPELSATARTRSA